jgi:ACT domain-containing protein
MKKFWVLIPIVLFGLFLILARIGKYNEFHKAEISGKIDTIYRYRDYVMFYVNKVEYRIIPVSLNNSPQLDNLAKIGDEIHKRADSDKFTLIHEEDEAFEYTIKKF